MSYVLLCGLVSLLTAIVAIVFFYNIKLKKNLKKIFLQNKETKKHHSHQLSELSHDLRTPLNAIMGYTSLLKNNIHGELNEKQLDYINKINSNSDRLLKIIDDYFTSSEM